MYMKWHVIVYCYICTYVCSVFMNEYFIQVCTVTWPEGTNYKQHFSCLPAELYCGVSRKPFKKNFFFILNIVYKVHVMLYWIKKKENKIHILEHWLLSYYKTYNVKLCHTCTLYVSKQLSIQWPIMTEWAILTLWVLDKISGKMFLVL